MTQSASITTYLTEPCPMPFCKGCGHSHVLRKLNEALVTLQLRPEDICLVTDIGCIGLADALFETPHTVHTTHGRSTAFATGIALADSVLSSSKLKTVVIIGDGGAMIGLLHLVSAALLNADLTVLLCNNFLFGMTGGQNSTLSPLGFKTPTTPDGNLVPPLDMCHIVRDSHAEFVARKLATDKDLAETIADAISHPGFSMVEIVELCTEHGTTRNELSGNSLKTILESHRQSLGTIVQDNSRKEFGNVYREHHPPSNGSQTTVRDGITPEFSTSLSGQIGMIIAGSAGERVQSTANKFCKAAALCGLASTQKNDNPVTQGSGFSLSELILSPAKIHYTGIQTPSVVIIVSTDGLREVRAQRLFERMSPDTVLIVDSELEFEPPVCPVIREPFRKEFGGKKAAAAALSYYLRRFSPFPPEAFEKLLNA